MRKPHLLTFLIAVFVIVMFLNSKGSVNDFNILETVDGFNKKEYTVRLFNQYPDGNSIKLIENTKILSGESVYLLEEDSVIPGLDENNNPGYIDVVVIGEEDISSGDIMVIPGLMGTIYEKTIWVETDYMEEEEDIIKNETIINGGVIEKNDSWSIENSPYIISGNILIPEGVKLLVEPGVEIIFDGDHSFIIEGELIFSGKKKNTIKIYGAR